MSTYRKLPFDPVREASADDSRDDVKATWSPPASPSTQVSPVLPRPVIEDPSPARPFHDTPPPASAPAPSPPMVTAFSIDDRAHFPSNSLPSSPRPLIHDETPAATQKLLLATVPSPPSHAGPSPPRVAAIDEGSSPTPRREKTPTFEAFILPTSPSASAATSLDEKAARGPLRQVPCFSCLLRHLCYQDAAPICYDQDPSQKDAQACVECARRKKSTCEDMDEDDKRVIAWLKRRQHAPATEAAPNQASREEIVSPGPSPFLRQNSMDQRIQAALPHIHASLAELQQKFERMTGCTLASFCATRPALSQANLAYGDAQQRVREIGAIVRAAPTVDDSQQLTHALLNKTLAQLAKTQDLFQG